MHQQTLDEINMWSPILTFIYVTHAHHSIITTVLFQVNTALSYRLIFLPNNKGVISGFSEPSTYRCLTQTRQDTRGQWGYLPATLAN